MGTSCLPEGCPALGTLSFPTAHPWGVRPGPATHTYDFTGQNVTLLKKYPKRNFLDSNSMIFGFSAPKEGWVHMKTFSKFHNTWH